MTKVHPPSQGQNRLAVIGSPISHSMSPVIHRRAFELCGLTAWSYVAHEVTADGFDDFVRSRDERWRGFSVTMPLKGAAAKLGVPDRLVHLTGVANTVVIDHVNGNVSHRVYNTDIGGFVSTLTSTSIPISTAHILGAGATALSAMYALGQVGAQVTISARNRVKAQALADVGRRLDISTSIADWGTIGDCDAVISTIPADAARAQVDEIVARQPRLVFDVIYDPWPTDLALAAQRQGITVLNGLDLLVHQATTQFELFTGTPVDAAPLLLAVRSAVTQRPRP